VRQSGKVSVYRLLEYVTQQVIGAAAQLGKPQNPTLRGRIDGELTWPIFLPGTHYQTAFPERVRPQITHDLYSLEAYGFPKTQLQHWAGTIPSLNSLQLAALNEFKLLEGEHLLVSAPTSSGKTMIGELAALKGVLERKRALFLLPLKALVADKYKSFTKTYGSFGIITIQATGETDDITPLLRGQYDICLLTYEKFAAVVLAHPYILDSVGTVVVDEVQTISDKSRGVNLEFVLTILRMRRRQGIEPQIIALSAVIGDTNGLERWLKARLLRRNERPVPLDEGILLEDGRFRYENISSRFLSAQTDPRSLIVRVLGAAKQLLPQGMQAEEIVEFLESSFGAFQQLQFSQQWQWDRAQLSEAIQSLLTHQLIERADSERYCLTPLGKLAGEAGVEVESVIRLRDCLALLAPDSLNDPTLLTVTQLTVELDLVLFPINKKSTNNEPHTWRRELQGLGVPPALLEAL
jgi:replicative superfamily II helicase